MKKPAAALLSLLLLSACGEGKLFTSDEKTPLTGERISVLQLQRDLTPDPAAQSAPAVLPEAAANAAWPQNGGNPHHAMGHLALGTALHKAWTASVGSGGGRRDPLIAPPVVADGVAYAIDTEGVVSAFALKDGKRKWRAETVPDEEEDRGSIGGGLALASGCLFATNGYKTLLALDPPTGKIAWRITLQAPARSAPATLDDRVYVITLDNKLLVFSAADGAPLWTHPGSGEETNLLGSATVASDRTLVVLPLSSGELFGLRPENGQVAWADNLSAVRRAGALSSIADVRGLPVIDGGAVYAVSYSGRLVALDAVTGRRLWQREVGGAETPWVAGDTLFLVTAEQQLAAFTRDGGAIRWNTQLPRFDGDDREKPVVWSGPVLAGGRLFAVSSGGEMIAADPLTGKILETSDLPGPATLPPVVADGTLLVLTTDGTLAAYR